MQSDNGEKVQPNRDQPDRPGGETVDLSGNNMRGLPGPFTELFRAFLNSWAGLVYALQTERAIRHEAVLIAVAIPVSYFVAAGPWQQVALLGILLFLVSIELLNTCVEKLCDHVTPRIHPQIKVVKDMGSAAVFCVILVAAIVWGVALAERLGFF